VYTPTDAEISRGGWYLPLRDKFAASLLTRCLRDRRVANATVLDSGCGTGGALAELSGPGILAVGTDTSLTSLLSCRREGRGRFLIQADSQALPFRTAAFDTCLCAEVLEHLDDDAQGLRELLRVSKGPVVVTVPAHPCLWTDSDDTLGHKRRYSREDVAHLVDQVQGQIVRIAPFGLLPALGVIVYKVLTRGAPAAEPRAPLASRFRMSRWMEGIMAALFRCELALSRARLLAWGHSWWIEVRGNDRIA